MKPQITVTPETKLTDILDAYPWLPKALAALNPQFKKLQSPLVRVILGNATVTDVSERFQVPAEELISMLTGLVESHEA